MTFKKYQTANNVKWQFDVWISAVTTIVILKTWQGALFPEHNGTTDKNYLCTQVKFDTYWLTVLKREIVEVTKRIGDSLTIVRSAWTCPWSDASTTQWTTAYAFDADDYIFLNSTAEVVNDLQTEVERIVGTDIAWLETNKLSKAEYQAWTYVYGASSTWNDDYVLTLPISPLAYAVWQTFRFLADVANTWPATLDINWLGAITIKKMHDQDLISWDIEAWSIVIVSYDWTFFQMDSQLALLPSVDLNAFGTGIDWDVIISTNVSLSADMNYNNLTISWTWILNPNWYKIYVKWTLLIETWWFIKRDWNNASWSTAWVTLNQWSLNAECYSWNWTSATWQAWQSANPSYSNINGANWWYLSNTWQAWPWWISVRWLLHNFVYSMQNFFSYIMNPASNLIASTQYKWISWSWGGWSNWSWTGWWGWSPWWFVRICANIFNNQWTIQMKWWNWWNATNAWGWGGWSGWILYLIYHVLTNLWTVVLTWWTAWTGWGWAQNWNTGEIKQIAI